MNFFIIDALNRVGNGRIFHRGIKLQGTKRAFFIIAKKAPLHEIVGMDIRKL